MIYFSVLKFNKIKLKFQLTWLQKWDWLAYSGEMDGVFCKYCISFCNVYIGKGSYEKFGSLVVKPFTKYKDVVKKFTSHFEISYHKFYIVVADNVHNAIVGEIGSIATQLNSQRRKECEENRVAIIETIALCELKIPHSSGNYSGPLSLGKTREKDGKFQRRKVKRKYLKLQKNMLLIGTPQSKMK